MNQSQFASRGFCNNDTKSFVSCVTFMIKLSLPEFSIMRSEGKCDLESLSNTARQLCKEYGERNFRLQKGDQNTMVSPPCSNTI